MIQVPILDLNTNEEGSVIVPLRKEGQDVKSLDVTGLPAGVTIQVEKSNDGKNWKTYPNNDGTPFIISKDGSYGLTPGRWSIQLLVDSATVPAGLLVTLL